MKLLFAAVGTSALLGAGPAPLLVYIPGSSGQVPQLQGWEVVSVRAAPDDSGIEAMERAVDAARKRREIDPVRTYIAGDGEGAAAVFYAASRRPDLWAAALALGGNPKAAIDTGRLFGGNTALVPVLWAAPGNDSPVLRRSKEKLAAAGFNLKLLPQNVTWQEALAQLAGHSRYATPPEVDCETGSPAFGRCYWVEITKFDPGQRNDVLPTTRVVPGSGAGLAIGGFGFNAGVPGPGVLVEWLPDNYKGPLKLGDRIVAVAGKEIADGYAYVNMMNDVQEEKRVGVILLRGKERIRIETRIVVPERGEAFTARVQARYFADSKEVLVISRGVGELRIMLPDHWAPAGINWNGDVLGTADAGGCWVLAAGQKARKCS
ncbi:MAG: hypothetical protein ACM3S5_09380 [Rhodospirillales bacterium]